MKISIITVCRNDLAGLERTFASIADQDCDLYEWLVIDGNSTDGTIGWLEEHFRFSGRWLSEADHGIYDAMNKGIGLASGDYLLFLNSGDRLAGPEVIGKLVWLIGLEKAAPDFVYGDSLDVAESGKSYYRKALPVSYIRAGMITRHQSMLYRRASVLDTRYPAKFTLSADYALTAKLLAQSDVRVLRVELPISLFSLGGVHDAHRVKALFEDFSIRREILRENMAACVLLFCVHWLHHYARMLLPSLNRKLIYKS